MDVDPDRLDPELRSAKLLALGSAALGLISLCAALVPICGGSIGILGIIAGVFSLKTESSRTAKAGIMISVLGCMITIFYVIFLTVFEN